MAQRSLAARSFAALALMVGFYALAIAIVVALVAIPYAEWTYGGRIHIRLLVACLVGAGAIAWSILPRPDRFDDPGPRLTPEGQPRLFELLRSVAKATQQRMPRDVFLVQDMNAWVGNRGGVMGVGSHRVMGLGLPLLQVLSTNELRAVLAHEFGHYHGGDTKLGPWIYKTRGAIGRTLQSLGDEGWLHLPFRWYGNFFLRVTQAISRAQEFTADRLAAATAGAAALIEGLKKVHAMAPAFEAYWQQEALPVLNSGFHAPLARGFERFLGVPRIEQATEGALQHALQGSEADAYDSHPPLAQRIAAVEDLEGDAASGADGSPPAISLLGDADAAESALLAFLARPGVEFERISWNDTTERIFLPQWREQAQALAEVVKTETLADLPELLRSRGDELASHFVGGVDVPDEVLVQALSVPLGAGILSALADSGWTVAADVGNPVTVSRGDTALEPFSVVSHLLEGAEGEAWWTGFLTTHGIASLVLARPPDATG